MLPANQSAVSLRAAAREAFIEGKNREPSGGGDRLVKGIRYVGVIDAASEKNRSNRWLYREQSMTGEALLATMLSEELSTTREDLLPVLGSVQRRVCAIARECSIDLDHPVNRPQAQLAVLDLVTGKIFRLGDCTYATVQGGRLMVSTNPKRVDLLMATERVAHIRPLVDRGVFDPLTDPGREKILPLFADCIALANREPTDFSPDERFLGVSKCELVYRCFDPRGELALEEYQLPEDAEQIIFASDGYQEVCADFWETESRHATALLVDPHGVRTPATKGRLPGSTGADDRSYLRLVIAKTCS